MTKPDLHIVLQPEGGYRDAAGRAPAEADPAPPRYVIEHNGRTERVHPHPYGRWACPACGAWRYFAWMVISPEYAVGASQKLERLAKKSKPVAPALAKIESWYPGWVVLFRRCPRCEFSWIVEPRETIG